MKGRLSIQKKRMEANSVEFFIPIVVDEAGQAVAEFVFEDEATQIVQIYNLLVPVAHLDRTRLLKYLEDLLGDESNLRVLNKMFGRKKK